MTNHCFKEQPKCKVDFGGVAGVLDIAFVDAPMIVTILEADLNVTQARALRDWLNQVLPDEPRAELKAVCKHGNGPTCVECSAENRT